VNFQGRSCVVFLYVFYYNKKYTMCRYGFTTYKPHFACFACRKIFKRRLLRDALPNAANAASKSANCPQCGGLMPNMGLDFKVPKTKERKAWQHLAYLHEVGITFHSCGCGGTGHIPKDKTALLAHLERIKKNYSTHRDFWAKRRVEPSTPEAVAQDERQHASFLVGLPAEARTSKDVESFDARKAYLYWYEKVVEVARQFYSIQL
jgi:hypothetical protein